MFFEFKQNDVFVNRIKAHPRVKFFLYSGTVYYNNRTSSSVNHVPNGYISLYELNVNRGSGELIYPFIVKDGSGYSFQTISTDDYSSQYLYGDTIEGTYPLSASLYRNHYPSGGGSRKYVTALKNVLDGYRGLSEHYAYSSSYGDKSTQDITLIDVPSIFFGSNIKRGSVDLRFFVSR